MRLTKLLNVLEFCKSCKNLINVSCELITNKIAVKIKEFCRPCIESSSRRMTSTNKAEIQVQLRHSKASVVRSKIILDTVPFGEQIPVNIPSLNAFRKIKHRDSINDGPTNAQEMHQYVLNTYPQEIK